MNILRLIAELGIDATGFNRGMDSAKAKAQQSGQAIGTAFKNTFTRFLGAAAIVAHIHNIVREIDNIEDSAQRLNITNEQFQRLSIAAEKAGQSLQGNKGIGRVFNELAELRAKAEGGDVKAMTALNQLGLSMLGAADASETMFDAFSKVINLTDSKLSEVFGGKILLDIKAFREELARVGKESIYSDEQIKKVKKADETFKSIGRSLKVGTAESLTRSPWEWFLKGIAPRAMDTINAIRSAKAEAKAVAGGTGGDIAARGGAGGDRAEALRVIQSRREQLQKSLRDLQQRADRSGGGMDMSNIIGTVAARFGARQALISTAAIREKPKPLPPELKQKMDEITNLLRMLVQEENNAITFSK